MSQTRGLYQLTDGTFVRTQAEIPKGEPTNKVEVPVGSQELCDYLNELIARERSNSPQLDVPNVEPQPAAAPPPPLPETPAAPKTEDHAAMRRKLATELRGMEVEAIEERILDMKGPAFGRVMAASVERLGALGKEGWQSLRGHFELFSMPTNYDRGLHLLALAQIDRMDEPKKPLPGYKCADAAAN